MKIEIFNNIQIIIGENAEENWKIIDFNSNYTWLHLNSFPSCHVIIQSDDIDNEILNYAGQLCKKNTKYKNLKNLKICYTKCNNLIKGTEIGSVYFKSNRKVKKILLS